MPSHLIGDYVEVFDEDPYLLPLLHCIRFAIETGNVPLDDWIRQILPPTEPHFAGGDPGLGNHQHR